MSKLGTAPGAAVIIDDDFVITAGNDRCDVVFKQDFENLRGHDLESIHDHGLFDQQTKQKWTQAVESVVSNDTTEATTQITLTPDGGRTGFTYELRVRPVEQQENAACCVLQSVETKQRYDETITALHAATRELMTADDVESALQLTAEAASDVLGFPGTGARWYDDETELLRHIAFGARINSVDDRPPYHIEESPHGRALLRNETIIDDIDDDDEFDREVFTQTMYIPIGNKAILSLGVVGRSFDEMDVQFAEILAENAEAAIREIRIKASLRQERERLDQFASVVSHDLRNPLSTASGYLEHARETNDPADFDVAADALARMDQMIDDLLALAKIETIGEKTTEPLQAVARDAWETAVTESAMLSLQDCEGTVECDRSLLQNLLENLFRNAVDHNESALTVRVGQLGSRDSGFDGFYVEDDGCGISEEDKQSVFRYGFSTTDDGTGFGLSIVEEIATVHSWEVTATDSAEGGARFEIETEQHGKVKSVQESLDGQL
jgi:signal transduction histidine kinase